MVIQYESFLNHKWIPIIRYDCAHGFFHKDVLYPDGEKEKHPITITNMEDAVNYANDDIKKRWMFYKEKYLNKLKK